jgi:tetratricopeptide (TPR) repeat protein
MIEAPEMHLACTLTDGDIAANNLESTRQYSWSRFWRDPLRPRIAEGIVEQEQLTLQFVGDLGALDRLDTLARQLDRVEAESPRTRLIRAQIASMSHRFVEAKRYLDESGDWGELSEAANRLSLSIDQACGTEMEAALETRRAMASKSRRLEDLVPLAALHADLREFDEADRIYQRALREYNDTSPFAVAWVCFQLGVLWGELVPEPQSSRAECWYRRAIEYLPCYVKARVHLSEIYLRYGRAKEAETLLLAAIPASDPEVYWRLADVLAKMGRFADAEVQMQIARSCFEALLEKHLLAFADHGAEFYSASGNDARRAFELASINLVNRPTLRAFKQAYEAAVAAGESEQSTQILASAKNRWGATNAFGLSLLVTRSNQGTREQLHDDRS